jgi:phage-related protein
MADGFETIGWVLKVEDKATTTMKKIVSALEAQVEKVAYSAGSFTQKIRGWGDKQGDVLKGVSKLAAGISESFGQVFGSLAMESGTFLVDKLKGYIEKGTTPFTSILAIPVKIKQGWKDLGKFFKKERTWGELLESSAVGVKKLNTGMLGLGKTVRGTASGVWSKMFGKPAQLDMKGATQNASFLRRQIDGIYTIGAGFKKLGGLAGIILGPFGKLLDLFSPFIDMIVEMLVPAFETFAAIIKTAFGPLAMTLEIVAQSLATAIVPFIKPLAAFLEIAAVQVGVMIQELLKGKPEAIFAGLFEILNAARPVLMHLMTVLFDAGKQIGGALFRTLVKVGPALLQLAVGLLDAIIPLIEPLTKLAVVLLEKVFVPALLAIAGWLDRHMPTISMLIEMLSEWITETAVKVDDFFSNFGKYANDFKVLFIDPVMSYIQPLIDLIEGVASGIKGLIGGDTAAERPMPEADVTGQAGGGQAAALREAAEREKALVGLTGAEREAVLQEMNRKRRGMAAGGVALKPMVPLIGEAGPEMVLPLRPDVIERTLAPIIPSIKFPALDRLVELASSIDRTLSQGTMRVLTTNPAQRAPDSGSDIALAPGMVGGGSW